MGSKNLWKLILCIVGLSAAFVLISIILGACAPAALKTEKYENKDGLQFEYAYEGGGRRTYLRFQGGDRTFRFNADRAVTYLYKLSDTEKEYAVVLYNDLDEAIHLNLYLWKSKEPEWAATPVP